MLSPLRKLTALVLLTPGFLLFSSQIAAVDYQHTQALLKTDKTIIGETIHYPTESPALITSLVVVLPPGEYTTWHKHPIPLYAYILQGELQVDYGDKGKKNYRPGDSFMEAMDQFHRGYNPGKQPVRILTVFMGTTASRLTQPKPD
jgi:quercetin dioxygenase-like cupin family protein